MRKDDKDLSAKGNGSGQNHCGFFIDPILEPDLDLTWNLHVESGSNINLKKKDSVSELSLKTLLYAWN